MVSPCVRSIPRSSISTIKSHLARSKPKSFVKSASFPSINRRFTSITRSPVELSCLGGASLYPLHSAVAEARLMSRLSTVSRCCRDLSQGTLCRIYPGL